MLSTIPEPARALIFPRRKGGPAWLESPKTRVAVCRNFRPDGNVLQGYSPSAAMNRLADTETT